MSSYHKGLVQLSIGPPRDERVTLASQSYTLPTAIHESSGNAGRARSRLFSLDNVFASFHSFVLNSMFATVFSIP